MGVVQICSNGGAICIIDKNITQDNFNIENIISDCYKIFYSETNYGLCEVVVHICLSGGASYITSLNN